MGSLTKCFCVSILKAPPVTVLGLGARTIYKPEFEAARARRAAKPGGVPPELLDRANWALKCAQRPAEAEAGPPVLSLRLLDSIFVI